MRGATIHEVCTSFRVNISIHAPHARSDQGIVKSRRAGAISIHAPHARSDILPKISESERPYFNPRSSCEERRKDGRRPVLPSDFNPRSSCEERPSGLSAKTAYRYFNPRSSCEERHQAVARKVADMLFQSTLLMRGATCRLKRPSDSAICISIHAPHARSDRLYWSSMTSAVNFNPRSSCEERLHKNGTAARGRHFNPRSSCEERHDSS